MRWQDLQTGLILGGRYLLQALLHARLRRAGSQIARSAVILGDTIIAGQVTLGANSVVNASMLDGRGGLVVGDNAFIARATVLTAGHDLDSPGFETTFGPVTIGDYAVLLTGAMVLPGVTIGRGAVVGAGAVVTRDVPELAIVAGSPARVVRQRRAIHDEADLRRLVGFSPKRLLAIRARASGLWGGRPQSSGPAKDS